MIFNRYLATRQEFPTQERASLREIWSHTLTGAAAPDCAGDYHGQYPEWDCPTASEAGVLACVYIIFLGAIPGRTLTWGRSGEALTRDGPHHINDHV